MCAFCPRLIASIFAVLALMLFVNVRAALSQDAAESGTSVDANWERVDTGPSIDEDAASGDKVLEIPPAKCSNDDESGPCNANTNTDASADDDGGIAAPSPGAPPQTFDEDTASTAQDPDWGSVDEYQNQQAYNVPYAMYPYPYPVYPNQVNGGGALRRPPQSNFAPVNGPLTQAARPPLNQGPWMTPPTMSTFSRPAGSPPAYGRPAGGPMTMSAPLAGFHH
jgi:hypothetical protein